MDVGHWCLGFLGNVAMETQSPKKLVAVIIVVAVATSFVTAMITIFALTEETPNQVAERIIEKSAPAGEKEISERVLRQDELVIGVVKRASPAVVSIVATKDVPVL